MTTLQIARAGVIAAGLLIAVAAFGASPRTAEAAQVVHEGAVCTDHIVGVGSYQYDENHVLVCM